MRRREVERVRFFEEARPQLGDVTLRAIVVDGFPTSVAATVRGPGGVRLLVGLSPQVWAMSTERNQLMMDGRLLAALDQVCPRI